jgi:hypothetical protein
MPTAIDTGTGFWIAHIRKAIPTMQTMRRELKAPRFFRFWFLVNG